MKTLTATAARKQFFSIISSTTKGHQTLRISHPSGIAVLMSEDDYEGLLETLELLSIPGFRESIRRSLKQVARGQTLSMDKVFDKCK